MKTRTVNKKYKEYYKYYIDNHTVQEGWGNYPPDNNQSFSTRKEAEKVILDRIKYYIKCEEDNIKVSKDTLKRLKKILNSGKFNE